jgi:hypothetical protein
MEERSIFEDSLKVQDNWYKKFGVEKKDKEIQTDETREEKLIKENESLKERVKILENKLEQISLIAYVEQPPK